MSQFSERDVYSGIRTSALMSWNSILGCDLCLFPASTTVNVTHRPVTQTAAKLPIPRTPTNHQVVYTTLPAPPAQNPVRGAVMPGPGLRPVNPQTGGRGCFSSMHTLAWHSLMCSTWQMWCSVFWFRFVNCFFFTWLVLIIEVRGFFFHRRELRKSQTVKKSFPLQLCEWAKMEFKSSQALTLPIKHLWMTCPTLYKVAEGNVISIAVL